MKLSTLLSSALISMALAFSHAYAEGFPNKPIKLVVPYPAGGMPDRVARDVAEQLSVRLKQPVIVENRGGAAGNIGFDSVARQPADGYTLILAPASNLTVQAVMFKSLSYRYSDFVPVSLLVESPQVLIVNPKLPVNTVQDLVKYSKEHPDTVNFGVATGSYSHLAGEMLRKASGADFSPIPYQGSNLALNDLLAGQVQFMFHDIVSAYPYIKAGRVKPLAVAFKSRVPWLQNVPTMAEAGFSNIEATSWYAIMARSGTERPIIDLLSKELSTITQLPDFKKRYIDIGAFTVGGTSEEADRFIKSERNKWSAIAKQAGIQQN